MNGDFFNSIGVADMEKVHSAVIGWMFSDNCRALNSPQKSELLCGLFGVNPVRPFKTFRVEVEHHNIDINIITDEQTFPECWVIENKIKSSQHSNQLDKYVDIIQGIPVKIGRTTHTIEDYKGMMHHFCFLTLVNEHAQCSKWVSWVNKTYKKFAQLLSKYNLSNNLNPDAVILNEYLSCILNLADALDDFLDNHQNYSNVFTDGALQKDLSKKTYAKAKGQHAQFIAENGLETIFQKCFLSHIMTKTKYFNKGFSISETHGTALAGKALQDVNKTELGIQFQNGSFKVQVVYSETDKKSTDKFWNKWDGIFASLSFTKTAAWKKNESQKRKGPYFSYSLKIKDWYKKDFKGIVANWDHMYLECEKVLNELKTHC